MGGINAANFSSTIDPVLLDPRETRTAKASSYPAFAARILRGAEGNELWVYWVYAGGVNQAKQAAPSFETFEPEATRTNFQSEQTVCANKLYPVRVSACIGLRAS
jgi:hypothetical protein